MFFYPSILYRVSFAKYAAAFFNISFSCFKIASSFLSLLFSCSKVSFFKSFTGNKLFLALYSFTHKAKVPLFNPKSLAMLEIDLSLLSIQNFIVDSLNSCE